MTKIKINVSKIAYTRTDCQQVLLISAANADMMSLLLLESFPVHFLRPVMISSAKWTRTKKEEPSRNDTEKCYL